MTVVQFEDVQGIALSSYAQLPEAYYVFLRLGDTRHAGAWLSDLLQRVTHGGASHRPSAGAEAAVHPNVNVAFTSSGLRKLGLSQSTIESFSREFIEGMGQPDRARLLGDTRQSAPEHWSFGGPTSPVDVCLLLFAKTGVKIEQLIERERTRAAHYGISVVTSLRCYLSETEHFGFKDGVSQPNIVEGRHDYIEPGEFLFGYRDEYGNFPMGPKLSSDDQLKWRLQSCVTSRFEPDLALHGTYLVVRQLSQDTAGFYRFMREKSAELGGHSSSEAVERLSAKLVGRWRSGAPLVLHPETDPGMFESTHDVFSYADSDARGLACPRGAHIRRTNPRDGLTPDPAVSLSVSRRHRLIRRGRIYGPRHLEPWNASDDGEQRGLVFICVNVNLRRQFEFVQQTWINAPHFEGLYDDRDPLLGDHASNGTFEVPEEPLRCSVTGMQRFVQARGGAYFFLPSVSVLRLLADFAVKHNDDGPVQYEPRPKPILRREFSSMTATLGERVVVRAQRWGASPGLLRPGFRFLREFAPVFLGPGNAAIVTRHAGVIEVLERNSDFTVASIYAKKMESTTGPFFLGMDDGPTYQREASIARAAFLPGDIEKIRSMVEESATALIDAARAEQRLDVVGSLTRIVPTRLVARFFGVPGPDEATLMRWMRTIFWEIFLNQVDTAAVRRAALVSSKEMQTYLEALIATKQSEVAASPRPPAPQDDFLTRLIRMQGASATYLDADAIRRTIGGIIVGAVDTTSMAATQAMAVLLRRPKELTSVCRAAAADDEAAVAAHLFEALRFHPHNPVIFRHCERDVTLERGNPKQQTIPAGTTVLVANMSAMFDPEVVEHPGEFLLNRPERAYIQFGHGQHTCFGLRMNKVQLPILGKALFRLKSLRVVSRLEYEGPLPHRLLVEFDK